MRGRGDREGGGKTSILSSILSSSSSSSLPPSSSSHIFPYSSSLLSSSSLALPSFSLPLPSSSPLLFSPPLLPSSSPALFSSSPALFSSSPALFSSSSARPLLLFFRPLLLFSPPSSPLLPPSSPLLPPSSPLLPPSSPLLPPSSPLLPPSSPLLPPSSPLLPPSSPLLPPSPPLLPRPLLLFFLPSSSPALPSSSPALSSSSPLPPPSPPLPPPSPSLPPPSPPLPPPSPSLPPPSPSLPPPSPSLPPPSPSLPPPSPPLPVQAFLCGCLIARSFSPLAPPVHCTAGTTVRGGQKTCLDYLWPAAVAENDLAFNVSKSKSMQAFVDAVIMYAKSYTLPTPYKVSGPLLDKLKADSEDLVRPLKDSWKTSGCTLSIDGWTCIKSRVVMDNATNNKNAANKLRVEYPHIFFTNCAAHCLDLMLHDIGNIPAVKRVLAQVHSVVMMIKGSTSVVVLFRELFTKLSLVRPGATRFGTQVIMLDRFLEVKRALRAMVISEEWEGVAVARTEEGMEVRKLLLDDVFWDCGTSVLRLMTPVYEVLRAVDTWAQVMGQLYGLMLEATVKTTKAAEEAADGSAIKSIIARRWDAQLHNPLHAIGWLLNPRNQYIEEVRNDPEIRKGMDEVIQARGGDVQQRITLAAQAQFHRGEGRLGSHDARWAATTLVEAGHMTDAEWWFLFGGDVQALQDLAVTSLSQPVTSSEVERYWSALARVQRRDRNRLTAQKMTDVTFVAFTWRARDAYDRKAALRSKLYQDLGNGTLREGAAIIPAEVPQFVADRWHKAGDKPAGEAAAGGGTAQGAPATPPPPGGGAGAGGVGVVGRVRMAFDPRARPQGGQAATQFMMRLEVPEGAAAELPIEYNLAFTPDHVPMHVFSESVSGRIALEGKVEHKFDMQPPSGDRGYRQMLQTREKKWNTPKRTLQKWDPSGAAGPRLPMPGTVTNVKRKAGTTPAWQQAAAARAADKDNKRVRMSRDVVEAKLFALFEERPHWTLKHLTDATQQPQQVGELRCAVGVVEAMLHPFFEECLHWTLKDLTDATQQP
ncbi:unnamed protein product [Closterium sp. Yama58-4]|nr:unnamed protein product [Closterium sp. Yama58-4]